MHILVSGAAGGRPVEGRQLVRADEVPADAVAVRYLVDGQELYGGPAPVGVAVPWATLGWHSGTHLLHAHALSDRSERLASASRAVWVANPIAVTSSWQVCPRIGHCNLSLKATPAGSGLVKVTAVAERHVSQEEISASVQQWGAPLRAAQRVDLAVDGARVGVAQTRGEGRRRPGRATAVANFTIDTRILPDGPHAVTAVAYTRHFLRVPRIRDGRSLMTEGYGLGSYTEFDSVNGAEVCEIRGEWRDVFLTSGTRALRVKSVTCAGVEQWLDPSQVTWTSTHPAVAAVDDHGRVAAAAGGVTYVRATYTPPGRSTPLTAGVRVVVAAGGHPVRHFTTQPDTPVRDTYRTGQSLLRNSCFFLSPTQFTLHGEHSLGPYLAVSGITAFENQIYAYGQGSRDSYEAGIDGRHEDAVTAARYWGMRLVGLGDDTLPNNGPNQDRRAACAVEHWDNCPYRDTSKRSRVQHCFANAEDRTPTGERVYLGCDMVDESSRGWGRDPRDHDRDPALVPADAFDRLIAHIRAVTDLPLAWPTLARAGKETKRNWGLLGDYESLYLDHAGGMHDLRTGQSRSRDGLIYPAPIPLGDDRRRRAEQVAQLSAGVENPGDAPTGGATGRCTLHVAVDPPTTTVDIYIDAERQPRTTRKGLGIAKLDLTDCSIPEPGHSHLLRADAGTNEARMVVTDRLLRGTAPP